MLSFAAAFLMSLVVAAGLTPFVLRFALRHGFYDPPGERKIHTRPIPRLGGFAIVLAFYSSVTALLLVGTGASQSLNTTAHIAGLYVGGLLIAAIGVYDDLKGANALQKLAVQIGVAVLMFALDYRIQNISNPFGGGYIELGALALPVTVLWYVGVINAVNLIDGLDGLAGGIGLISVSVLFALGVMDNNTLAALFCAALAGSLAGFLFFNFNPARIFMGDTGSLFLGFVLATFSISTSSKGSTTVALVIPMLALGLPILDTFLAIGRRVRKQRPIFSADQDHIHHKLLRAGLTHRQAVVTLYVVACFLAAAALLMRVASDLASGLILLVVALVLFVLFRLLAYRNPDVRGVTDPFADNPSGLDRAAIATARAGLEAAASTADIAAIVDELAARSGVATITIARGDATLYAYARMINAKEAVRGLSTYQIPLGDALDAPATPPPGAAAPEATPIRGCAVSVQFIDAGLRGDLASVVPWELVATALGAALERFDWAPIQPGATLHPPDPKPLLAIPSPGLTPSHPGR